MEFRQGERFVKKVNEGEREQIRGTEPNRNHKEKISLLSADFKIEIFSQIC